MNESGNSLWKLCLSCKLSSVPVWLFCFALLCFTYIWLFFKNRFTLCVFLLLIYFDLFDRHRFTVIYANPFDNFVLNSSSPQIFFSFYMVFLPLWLVLLAFFCSVLRKSVDIVLSLWVFSRLVWYCFLLASWRCCLVMQRPLKLWLFSLFYFLSLL